MIWFPEFSKVHHLEKFLRFLKNSLSVLGFTLNNRSHRDFYMRENSTDEKAGGINPNEPTIMIESRQSESWATFFWKWTKRNNSLPRDETRKRQLGGP